MRVVLYWYSTAELLCGIRHRAAHPVAMENLRATKDNNLEAGS